VSGRGTGEEHQQGPYRLPAGATELVLVRHGASQPARPGHPFPLVHGREDPDLETRGREQARQVARAMGMEPFRHVFVTPLKRTRQTAQPLCERLGLVPHTIGDLAELCLGEWEGGGYRLRVARRDPDVRRMHREERWDMIPGAEPAADFSARVRRGIEGAAALTGSGGVAVVVTHGFVIGEVLRLATGSRPFAFVNAENGSISRLVVRRSGRWELRSFNETAHLSLDD